MNDSVPTVSTRRPLWLELMRRGAELLFFLWLLHGTGFLLFDLLPSAAISQLGIFAADPATLKVAHERLGLNGTLIERYWQSLSHVATGNLGKSVQGGYDVAALIQQRLISSTPLLLATVLTTFFVGIPSGMLFCQRRLSRAQSGILLLAHVGLVPQFLAAALFAAVWMWIAAIPVTSTGIFRFGVSVASCALLPTTTLFLATANSLHELAKQPFVMNYQALGVSPSFIRWRLLWNLQVMLRPLGARLVLTILTGTVFAEYAFNQPGVGALLVDALKASDFPVAFAWLLFAGGAVMLTSVICEGRDV